METDVYENEYVQKGDLLAIVGSEAVRAKTNGLIVMANTQTGSMANATNPVVQMIQPEDMRIAGTIDENKGLKDIKVGQVASFSVDAIPGKTYWGYVDEVSPSAKQTQISFSISSERPTQQFVVYVKYDSLKYPEVKNGMSAKLTIYTNTN
jgi:multidrug resistance efflux pump